MYVREATEYCAACHSATKPQRSRKDSLVKLSGNFNDIICIDHVLLHGLQVLQVMHTSTRYLVGTVVSALSVLGSIAALEVVWFLPFWPVLFLYGDYAFANAEFRQFVESISSSLCLVPSQRHSKKVLELRNGAVRSTFLQLKKHYLEIDGRLLAVRKIRISNDLFCSDVICGFGMAIVLLARF